MRRRIGFHVSIAGGLPKAVRHALERGCTTLQVFCGSPRSWKLQARTAEEIEQFRLDRAAADLSPLSVHSCYLVNPCSPNPAVFAKSVSRLSAELGLAAAIGADYYVLHPGSHKGLATAWGVKRAAHALTLALRSAAGAPTILLENTASPHGPGSEFLTLAALAEQVEGCLPTVRVGLALDSCHAFCAGYDLRNESEVERLVADANKTIGLERLGLLHVNDAKDDPGSRRDRHEHIGRGTIGNKGLRNFLNHPALAALPLVLETPWKSTATDRRNLKAVLGLLTDP